MRVKIKICGITRVADGLMAAEAGADAIGLVFADSPRRVSLGTARKIVAALPPFVTPVGVFVNEKPSRIRQIVRSVGLLMVQLHGDEAPLQVLAMSRDVPVIKAIRVRDGDSLSKMASYLRAGARAVLLDSYGHARAGGTGRKFDWGLLGEGLDLGEATRYRIILAGGLHPGNVASAIRRVRPWGVDVSSGVERAPGEKSAELVRAFIDSARRVETRL